MFCSTSIVRRNMRRLDAECRRCEAREISNPQPPTPAASCTERPAGAGWIWPKQHQQAVLGATDRQRIIQKEGLAQTISVDGMRVRGWNVYIYRYISLSIYCEPNDAVRAAAVAKRREYISILEILKISSDLKIIVNDPRNYQSHLFISTSHSDFKNQPTGPRRVSHLGITRSLRFVNVLPKSHRRLEPLEEPWRNHGGTIGNGHPTWYPDGIRRWFFAELFLRGIATSKVAANRWPMTELRLSNSWEEKRTLVDQHLTTVCQWYWLYQLNPGEDQRILPPDCWLTQYGYTWVYYMDICGQLNVDIQ